MKKPVIIQMLKELIRESDEDLYKDMFICDDEFYEGCFYTKEERLDRLVRIVEKYVNRDSTG